MLIAGEAAYYPDNAAAQSFGTDGTEPAVIWFASLGGDVPPPPEGQISKVQRGFVWAHEIGRLGSGHGATMELRRLVLPIGTTLTNVAPTGTELVYVERGAIQVSTEGELATPGAVRINRAGDGTRLAPTVGVTITNAAAETTSLVVLAIEPAGGVATPAA